MSVEQSRRLYLRAQRLIPGGTQTISKRPDKFVPEYEALRGMEGHPDSAWDQRFVAGLLKAGILMRPQHCAFVAAAHTEDDIDRTIAASAEVLEAESIHV